MERDEPRKVEMIVDDDMTVFRVDRSGHVAVLRVLREDQDAWHLVGEARRDGGNWDAMFLDPNNTEGVEYDSIESGHASMGEAAGKLVGRHLAAMEDHMAEKARGIGVFR